IVGINQGTITNSYYLADEETEDGGKTSEQFASGEVAYLLGEAFGQKIGTDACPVLAGDKIYCGYKDCTTTEKVYSNSPLYDSYEEIPEHTHEFADIDFDGRLTVRDATALAKALAGITTLTDCQQAVADVNNDGMININDVTYIQMMLADLV
ncbi:MAG: dockerin type I repeat-containing protein, partial [Ruminococcus sp.]|nr:dockerin type I repeat-containing protein [Ruminococcus sp.]